MKKLNNSIRDYVVISRITILILLFALLSIFGYGQKDTVWVEGMFGGQGILQTGNISQFGFNLNGNFETGNDLFEVNIFTNYAYAEVNKINRINDSWNYSVFKLFAKKRVYPATKITAVHAKSFGITSAFIGGIGGGINIIERTSQKRFELNLTAGYGRFDYFVNDRTDGLILNAYVRGDTRFLKDNLILDWIFHGYAFPAEQNFFGISTNFQMTMPISKRFGLTFSNLIRYSQVVDSLQKRLNTTTSVGIKFKR